MNYIYQGDEFPCSIGCPDVINLPHLHVAEYLQGQETKYFEDAQDAYLELMQNIADIAFVLLLDSGLVDSKETKTLQKWKMLGELEVESLFLEIEKEWIEELMLPVISDNLDNPISFVNAHNGLLQIKAQEKFGIIQTNDELHRASVQMIALAIYLAKSIGSNTTELVNHWVEIAISHGARL